MKNTLNLKWVKKRTLRPGVQEYNIIVLIKVSISKSVDNISENFVTECLLKIL